MTVRDQAERRLPLLIAVVLAALLLLGAPARPELLAALDNDNAMRLVMVRDLLAGQPWFDLVQPRLGPQGTEMHWSRLVDAPIAGLIAVLEPLAGRAQAEYLAIMTWPVLMFAAVVLLAGRIGLSLGGRAAGAVAAAVTGLTFLPETRFAPGSVDHHNVQIALLLLVVLGLVARHERPGFPALAGLALAASLAVGVETLPLLALCGLFVAGIWAARGAAERGAALRFTAALGGGLVAVFVLTAPASAWRGGFCDALSRDLAGPVLAGAAALALAAGFASRHPAGGRLAALAAVAAAAGLAALAMPACLSNPLDGLDPYLKARWLAIVSEARGLDDALSGAVTRLQLGYFAVGAAAAVLALHAAWRERRAEWLLLAVLIAVAFAMGAYQLRGAVVLSALSAFPVAGLAARLYRASRATGNTAAAVGVLLCLFLPLPVTWSLGQMAGAAVAVRMSGAPDDVDEAAADPSVCFTQAAFASLAARPPGLVSAPSNLGAQILLNTSHRVLSAPYHRNQAGMTAQLRIALSETDAGARSLLRAHGVDYVAVCPADAEADALAQLGFEGFLHRLETGSRPAFLAPLPAAQEAGLQAFELR